jgi:hypothetical protein
MTELFCWPSSLRLCVLVGAAVAVSCNQDATQGASYAVSVRALDDQSKPLPGVQLSAAGRALGATDDRGQLALSMPGAEGQRVDLVASCPTNYKGPRERPAFLLARVRNAQGELSDQPIEVSLTCDATDHIALVAVQTGQAGLPILVRGQVVAQTSEAGTAHVLLRDPVGSSFQVMLDTSAKRELLPENPTRTFTVARQDAFSVWEQTFELEKRAPSSASRKHAKRRGGAAAASSKHNSPRSR